MPVLIAGFERDLDIIRPLAEALRAEGGEVRCYLEDDDHELRSFGCKIAVGRLDDADTLTAALTNVHTFVPMLSDVATFTGHVTIERLDGFVKAIEVAIAESDISQCIAPISGVAAGALAEILEHACDAVRGASFPACLIKTGFITGDERPLSIAVAEGSDPAASLAVSSVETLVATIVAADDLEELEGELTLGGMPVPVMALPTDGSLDTTVVLGNSALERLQVEGLDAAELRRYTG